MVLVATGYGLDSDHSEKAAFQFCNSQSLLEQITVLEWRELVQLLEEECLGLSHRWLRLSRGLLILGFLA